MLKRPSPFNERFLFSLAIYSLFFVSTNCQKRTKMIVLIYKPFVSRWPLAVVRQMEISYAFLK